MHFFDHGMKVIFDYLRSTFEVCKLLESRLGLTLRCIQQHHINRSKRLSPTYFSNTSDEIGSSVYAIIIPSFLWWRCADDRRRQDLRSSLFLHPASFSFLFRQMISDVLRCSSANLPGFDDVTSSDLSFIKNLTEYNNVHNTDPISRDN